MNGPDTPELNRSPSMYKSELGVDVRGPVFLSYRQSDGSELALRLAWALRGIGVPVWHDVTDLPPGDTERRLEEALNSGLSGSILIVTPEVQNSKVIRNLELPRLIELNENSEFTFAIASVVEDDYGQLDYAAADRFLSPTRSLSSFLHLPVRHGDEITRMVLQVAIQRMQVLKAQRQTELLIDIQSRKMPAARTSSSDLVIRTHPPRNGNRVPPPAAWSPLRSGLAALPNLVDRAGVSSIVLTGGAHLTMAFAIGAALPETAQWPVTVIDQFGNRWEKEGDSEAQQVESASQALVGSHRNCPPAVFVDLVPTPEPANTFGRQVAMEGYKTATRITLRDRVPMEAVQGVATVREIAQQIRLVASNTGTNQIALFLRCPFAAAVLLGRFLNTLSLDLYEWDDTTNPPSYIPTITVASGRAGGPITEINHINSEEWS